MDAIGLGDDLGGDGSAGPGVEKGRVGEAVDAAAIGLGDDPGGADTAGFERLLS